MHIDLHPVAAPPSALIQPIPMDTTGDLRIDLFGATPSDTETFKVWRNVWNASAPGEVFSLCVVLSFRNRTKVTIDDE